MGLLTLFPFRGQANNPSSRSVSYDSVSPGVSLVILQVDTSWSWLRWTGFQLLVDRSVQDNGTGRFGDATLENFLSDTYSWNANDETHLIYGACDYFIPGNATWREESPVVYPGERDSFFLESGYVDQYAILEMTDSAMGPDCPPGYKEWQAGDSLFFSYDACCFTGFDFKKNHVYTFQVDASGISLTERVLDTLVEEPGSEPEEPEGVGSYSDLIISEYVEGSGNNKAIEIYNGTGKDVDLAAYSLMKQVNGSGDYGGEDALSGILADDETFVVVSPSASAELRALGDMTSNVTSFNGDDAVALFKNGEKVDEVGIFNGGRDNLWGRDVTLRRLPGLGPNLEYDPAEWEVCSRDDFSDLGKHAKTYAAFDSLLTYDNDLEHLSLYFTAALDADLATLASNYRLSGDVEVLSASLSENGDCVTLETTPMQAETEYVLTISGLKDELGNTLDTLDIKFISAVEGKIAISSTNFPDDSFRGYVGKNFDSDSDGYLSEEELTAVHVMRIGQIDSSLFVRSLAGLEFFPAIDTLVVVAGEIPSIDLGVQSRLRYVELGALNLQSLDLSRNADLSTLICPYAALKTLDLSSNPALEYLDCSSGILETLDLSHNANLKTLNVSNNFLKTLQLNANLTLEDLNCSYNDLSSLDLSEVPNLKALNVSNNALESLNLASNPSLERLNCSYNNLLSLDLASNPDLVEVFCTYNRREVEINSENNTFNLSSLPGFDGEKASHWMGALVDGNTLTFVTETATYQYENGFTGGEGSALPSSFEFTLVASNFNPDLPDPTAIPIDETNFPDRIFRTYVANNFDQTGDGALSQWEADAVTRIDLVSYVTGIDGIEYFPNLEHLGLWRCDHLNSLAILENKNLEALFVYRDAVEGLNLILAEDILLDSLYIVTPFLGSLDLRTQRELRYLVYGGVMDDRVLDVSNNEKLQYLSCVGNEINELDLSRNVELQYLDCSYTNITELDLSRNAALRYLDCSYTNITELDLSQNKELEYVNCAKDVMWVHDGGILIRLILDNPSLLSLDCSYNGLTVLDLSRVPALQTLNCATNNFNELDLSQSPSLQDLDCSNNKLMDLTLGKQDSLRRLICSNNEIKTLDVNQCPSLQELYCSDVPIQVLDLTQNPKLKILECDRTALAGLDLSQNPELFEFSCQDIRIEVPVDANYSFDMGSLSGFQPERTSAWSGGVLDGSRATFSSAQASYQYNTGAAYASMRFMPVTVDVINFDEPGVAQLIPIDAEHFPDAEFRADVSSQFDVNENGWLTQAEIDNAVEYHNWSGGVSSLKGIEYFSNLRVLQLDYDNHIDSLDLSQNLLLEEVNCRSAGLVFLNISQNAALRELNCSDNHLSNLDLSGTPVLQRLYCANNNLSNLDLSKTPDLLELICHGNFILGLDLSRNPSLRYFGDVSSRLKIDENNQIDLAEYPGFSVANASDWENAIVNGSLLSFLKPYASYTYQTGNPELGKVRFSIDVENFTDNTEDVLAIDAAHFPASGFRMVLSYPIYDWNQNGFFSQKELEALTELDIPVGSSGVTLEGIGHLVYLKSLDCSGIETLTELDLKQNTALEHLNCACTGLTSLDVSQNRNLRYLDCSGESWYGEVGPGQLLKKLQLPSSLDTLICSGLLMTSLDLGQVPSLVCLICDNSRFETLDLSQTPDLRHFSCSNGVLSSLDLSRNPALEIVECAGNATHVMVDEYNRFDLDTLLGFEIEKVIDWYYATPSGSILTFPDPEIGGFDESMVSYTYRTGTPVAGADFAKIQFSLIASNYNDEILESDTNGLAINAVHFPDSIFREYVRNHFDLNASGYLGDREIQRVREIEVEGLGIKSLQGIEVFLNLHDLLCSGNQLTELDLRENKNLDFLDCSANRLDTLLLSGVLTSLYCERNQLESLDLDSLSMLTVLSCSNNRLKELDLSANTCLDVLRCSYNNLVSLDLSRNNGLDVAEYFECVGNKRVVEVGADNRFDLSTLSGFDLSRASRWVGAELEGNVLKFNEKQVIYSYYTASVYTDLGTDTVTFSLEAENFHPGDQPQPDTGLLVNSENFPDSIFRTYVATVFDKDGNGELSDAEIQDATVVNVDGLGIENLEGIGFLAALRELYCSNNHLVSLNLSRNPLLDTLECSGNYRLVELTDNAFDLSCLLGFDMAYASAWNGATLDAGILTFLQDTVTYEYAHGYIGENAIPETVSLTLCGLGRVGLEQDAELAAIRVFARGLDIHVENTDCEVEIYSQSGALVYRGYKHLVPVGYQGVYIVRVETRVWKLLVL